MKLLQLFINCLIIFAAIFLGDRVCLAQQAYEKAGLTIHNSLRSKHDSKPLALSEELNVKATKCAEDYARRNAIDHKCQSKSKGEGENLFLTYTTDSSSSIDPTKAMKSAINLWYGEIKYYNYENPGQFQEEIRHFTQVVWDGSTQLGCGVGTVKSNQKETTVVCCLYRKPGNILSRNGDKYQYYKTNVKRRHN